MGKIKFPPLHKGLSKTLSETFVAADYIRVINNHALVCHPNFIVAVDLEGLFAQKKNTDIDPDYDFENALDILEFLDGKYLSASFWNELVTAPSFEMSDDDEYIVIGSRGTSKELHYVAPLEAEGDSADDAIEKYVEMLRKAKFREPLGASKASIRIDTILKINAMTNVKADTIILEHFGEDKPVRFSFGADPTVFGVLGNNYDLNDKLYLDQSLTNFIEGLEEGKKERKSVKELKKALAESNVEFELVPPK